MTADIGTPEGVARSGSAGMRRAARGGLLGLALAAGFVGTAAIPASAANNGSTTANVGVSSGITMTGLTPSFTLSGAPGETVTGNEAVSLNVETNNVAGYAVTVQSRSATMLPPVGTNTDSIPIGDLTVRETGVSTFTPMTSGSAVQVHTQGSRSANGGDTLTNDYQIRIPVVNLATYSATLDYIATSL